MQAAETFTLADENEMLAFGEAFSARLDTGDAIALTGELGAGKTTFCRGVLRGLGYKGEVRSPTFNLLHEYDTTPPILHADLYRLEPSDAAKMGLADYLWTRALLVEWAERLPNFDWTWRLRFETLPVGRVVFSEKA